ncbi:hypothetical protein FEF65_12475 [Mariprofundus erugo]|uniref:FimV N-terminal domain-containing protein n=1 Tax=Mariprofundus erugo TaxID=2528639 RepID=A0A5R9GF26_9PROT|nr:FimV/HubP family polar landmark protein [Mariprofundus erugo]TLS65636.1 hypothetical protein FEF65_12475 [Mariprofundus erugo]
MKDKMGRYRQAGFLVTLLTVFCLLPLTAAALGFGAISLKSHLNEPLEAELSLMLGSAEAIDQVRVELANEMEYRQMGLYRNPELAKVQVARLEHSSHGAVVRLFTTAPVHSPILSIVLKVSKAGRGTYFRHYRLLFDAVETPVARSPLVVPLQDSAASVAAVDRNEGDEWARVSRYGPVQPGESLGRIATRLRKDDRFNNRQVMLALYDKNLQEFVSGDINNLKQGSWLNVPDGEVVRSYGDEASMLRLSLLLQHTTIAADKPAEAAAQPSTESVPEDQAPLHYSGRIALNGEQPGAKREVVVDQALSAIHDELMAGKLQMTDLGKSVAVLNASVAEIQGDIRSLKHDVAAIHARPQVVVNQTEMSWQVAFYLLLAAIAGGLLGFLVRRHTHSGQAETVAVTSPKNMAAAEPVKKTAPVMPVVHHPVTDKPADAVIQLMNKVEERLGRCDYEEASRLLDEVDARATGSLKAAALRAQIYHETGRSEACLALINHISESSDKDSWQRFCQLLPAHVWSACFGEEDSGDTEKADDEGRLSL